MSINTKIFVYSIFFLLIQSPIIAQSTVISQSDSVNQSENFEISHRETRARLVFGFNGYPEDEEKYYFLNLHSRIFKKATSELQLDYAIEWGINFPYILPYFKVGPELRVLKNIYLDAHAGIGIFIVPAPSNPFGFWGAEIGYSLKISRKIAIDLETGANYLLDNRVDNVYFPYVTIGLSILNK